MPFDRHRHGRAPGSTGRRPLRMAALPKGSEGSSFLTAGRGAKWAPCSPGWRPQAQEVTV